MSLLDGLLKRRSRSRTPSVAPPQEEPVLHEPAAILQEPAPVLHEPTAAPLVADTPSESPENVAEGLAAARDARGSGDIAAALAICAGLRTRFPDDAQPIRLAASMLIEAGRLDEAEALLDGDRQLLAVDAGIAIDHAWISHRRRNFPEALRRWEHVRNSFPNHPTGWSGAVSSLRDSGDLNAAEEMSKAALEKFANNASVMIEHGWTASRRREFQEAIRRWEALREKFPGLRQGYVGGAQALSEVGRHDEADQLLHAASERFPDDPSLSIEMARAAMARRDWPVALSRWAIVRTRIPDHPAAVSGEAVALRELQRFDEADALLAQAAEKLQNEPAVFIDRAWIAQRRGDLAESLKRWEQVREKFPGLLVGYTGAATALRDLKRVDEAEAMLLLAIERFPSDPGASIEFAWLAHRRRDWPEAIRRWDAARERFPHTPVPLTAGCAALRELRRFNEAEARIQDACERFPTDMTAFIESAWLANSQRDWPTALQRWERVRDRFPERPEFHVRVCETLTELWRFDEAEAKLAEGMARFPNYGDFALQHARMALRHNNFEVAAQRFADVRARFPHIVGGWTGGAYALRYQFKLAEADALLEEAALRLPSEPAILLNYAQIPTLPLRKEDRDRPEAVRRFRSLCERFPDFVPGHVAAIRCLCEGDDYDAADAAAVEAVRLLPDSADVALAHAEVSRERADWPEAVSRYHALVDRFPDNPQAYAGLGGALVNANRTQEAESVLRDAMERFPFHAPLFASYAEAAVQRHDWAEALQRWKDAQRRFPDERRFAHRVFEAELRLTEVTGAFPSIAQSPAVIDTRSTGDAPDDARGQIREKLMQFESLGGRGLGCEFGIFQRDYGAEPLSLLRWADMPHDKLVQALESRFEGVGEPENTMLFLDRKHRPPEYCTQDNRGMMFMRAFIYEDEISYDQMWTQALRRLQFLRRKLIADLEAGDKIFVYRITNRNLTDDEVDQLWRAVRGYGDTTLLYVRYEDAQHPNGSVEYVKPGLMIGYMDRFKQLASGEMTAAPANASWAAVCMKAHELWQAARNGSSLPAEEHLHAASMNSADSMQASHALTDQQLMLRFESLGGGGHGCEFGIVQRDVGVEPLGLLRWADLDHHCLSAALETRFDGVGLPENTEIRVPPGEPDWWTKDKRHWMAMRTFIKGDAESYETMVELACRRLQYLRDKLIDDLTTGDKIFVYKNLVRNLTDTELTRLYSAVRSYGDSTLFYVRYEDQDHRNGTVEVAGPGLMIGYIDHFAFSPEDKPLGSARESWLALCRQAYPLWVKSREDARQANVHSATSGAVTVEAND
jgi:tetratricopeptide (TPR) repeat protein